MLAADGHEAQLADELEQLIELDQLPDLQALTALLAPRPGVLPEREGRIARCWPAYDDLLEVARMSGAAIAAGRPPGPDADRTEAADDQAARRSTCARSPTARAGPAIGCWRRCSSTRSTSAKRGASSGIAPSRRLSPDKRLSSFDFAAVPSVSKAQVMALAEGTEWLDRGANVLLFGPPGVGKSHLIVRPRATR